MIDYLFQHRPEWSEAAAVGKTLVSSQMIDRVTRKLGRKLYEVPVGFKWFVDGLLDGSLVEMGERAQALHEYERCRDAVRSSLDVEPSSETRALYQALRTFSSVEPPPVITGPAGGEPQELPLRAASRLRVAVRPFQALAPHVETLAVLLSQEIAAGLARFRWFDVIAPATYREGSFLPQNQADYIVEANLSGSAQRVQVSVRLIDVSEQSQLVWSDRFDMPAAEIDDLNERIVGPVVARIDPVIALRQE